jgi:hypothetical protein
MDGSKQLLSSHVFRPQLVTARALTMMPTDGARRSRSWLGPLLALVVAVLVIGFLVWPLLFSSTGLAPDWTTYLWFMWQQGRAIESHHLPSLFIDQGAVFYPHFAFYGGTLYVFGGLLSTLLGDAPITAYVIVQLLAFAAVYGGWYWMARMAGLGHWLAQVPGLVFITSAYYLTDIYGRGDFGEFMAISTIPLMLAAGLHLLLAERLSFLPALALAVSAALFFGSHNITMLYGVSTIVAVGGAVALSVPRARRRVARAGVIRVACLLVPAALLNSWFLLPALAYGKRTLIVQQYGYAHALRQSTSLVSAANLFTFSRATVSPYLRDFVMALPILAIVWVLAGVVSCIGRRDEPWVRALWIFAGASLVLGLLMTHPGVLLVGPTPYSLLQFSYRLQTFVLLNLSGAVLATLVLARSRTLAARRLWMGSLAIVVGASAVGAIQQVDAHPNTTQRSAVFHVNRNAGAGYIRDYSDASLPIVNPADAPEVEFPPATVLRNEAATVAVELPAGQLVRTNLAGAPYFVSVSGAEVVGRDPTGAMVLRVGSSAGASGAQVSVRPANRLPVVVGRLVTLLALAALVLVLGRSLLLDVRTRRGSRAPA